MIIQFLVMEMFYYRNLIRATLKLSYYKFAICPEGNGVDCHRIWECIYLGVVPIIIDSIQMSFFKYLHIYWIHAGLNWIDFINCTNELRNVYSARLVELPKRWVTINYSILLIDYVLS